MWQPSAMLEATETVDTCRSSFRPEAPKEATPTSRATTCAPRLAAWHTTLSTGTGSPVGTGNSAWLALSRETQQPPWEPAAPVVPGCPWKPPASGAAKQWPLPAAAAPGSAPALASGGLGNLGLGLLSFSTTMRLSSSTKGCLAQAACVCGRQNARLESAHNTQTLRACCCAASQKPGTLPTLAPQLADVRQKDPQLGALTHSPLPPLQRFAVPAATAPIYTFSLGQACRDAPDARTKCTE